MVKIPHRAPYNISMQVLGFICTGPDRCSELSNSFRVGIVIWILITAAYYVLLSKNMLQRIMTPLKRHSLSLAGALVLGWITYRLLLLALD